MITFSRSAQAMRSSEIRRLMALASDPAIISFAGGSPANSLFPIEALDDIWANLSIDKKQTACQYGATPGFPPLIREVKKYLAAKGLPIDGNEVIITTGAQQAINLVTKVLVDPGDHVVTEYPSFIGALAAFMSYGARLHGVTVDNDGIAVDKLDAMLAKLAGPRLKMLYLCPVFQNPGGTVYSIERKQEVVKLLNGKNIVLLEDDPYCELYFDDSDAAKLTPMKVLARESIPICYVGSFAKIFGPGMRLGWLLAPKEIVEKVELAKQSADACSPSFTQVLAYEYLSRGKLPGYLAKIRPAYARRARMMLDALERHMPEGVTWTTPRGGFFVWVTMPKKYDSSAVFQKAIARGAAFVIGSAFDPEARRNNGFRLAFSFTPEETIEKGIAIVADAVKAVMQERKSA